MKQHSPTVAIILSKLNAAHKGKPMSSVEGHEEPGPEGSPEDVAEDKLEYEAAAEEILAAIKENDKEALAESLHAFIQLCEDEPHEESEVEPEEESEGE